MTFELQQSNAIQKKGEGEPSLLPLSMARLTISKSESPEIYKGGKNLTRAALYFTESEVHWFMAGTTALCTQIGCAHTCITV